MTHVSLWHCAFEPMWAIWIDLDRFGKVCVVVTSVALRVAPRFDSVWAKLGCSWQ